MFNNVLGHEPAKSIFSNIIANKKIAHSYLFSGPPGVGKFLFALELAKILLCEKEKGCGKCYSCNRVTKNIHSSLNVIQAPEKRKYISIDKVRDLEKEISLKPFEGKYKIFIINDAERLSEEASNALLKTLEEPPGYSLIVLVSAKHEVLPKTVLSRCHAVRFHRLSSDLVSELLKKQLKLTEDEIKTLVNLSSGSIGQALNLYKKDFLSQRHRLIQGVLNPDQSLADEVISFARKEKENEKVRLGVIQQFKIITSGLRDIMLFKNKIITEDKLFNPDKINVIKEAKEKFSSARLERAVDNIIQAEQNIRLNLNINLVVTSTILNI